MATFEKRSGSVRVQLMVNGVRHSATLPTMAEAKAWALEIEEAGSGKLVGGKTLKDALDRYEIEVARRKTSAASLRWTVNKLRNFRAYPLAKMPLASIQQKPHITGWRDERETEVSGETVNRELNLLHSVFTKAVDWNWIRANPSAGLKRPKGSERRCRRITEKEIKDVTQYGLGYKGGKPQNDSQFVALAWLFAIETGMRGGEILGTDKANVHPLKVHVPKELSKNGIARDVPLTKRAREILALLPPVFKGKVWPINAASKDALFRKGRDKAGVANLHFHDSRAEAIYRLAAKLSILELAKAIGHKNPASLMMYYAADADELAAKLG